MTNPSQRLLGLVPLLRPITRTILQDYSLTSYRHVHIRRRGRTCTITRHRSSAPVITRPDKTTPGDIVQVADLPKYLQQIPSDQRPHTLAVEISDENWHCIIFGHAHPDFHPEMMISSKLGREDRAWRELQRTLMQGVQYLRRH